MGVRKVVTRRGKRVRGYFPSSKTRLMIAWESVLERDALALIELSSAVVRIESQPMEFLYWDPNSDKERSYFPDFRVELRSGDALILEVKPTRILNRPDERARFKTVAAEFAATGQAFRIITDETIRLQPRLSSMRTLVPFSGPQMAESDRIQWLEKLANVEACTLNDWTPVLGTITRAYRLIAQGVLLPDWQCPLNPNMPVSLNEEMGDVLHV